MKLTLNPELNRCLREKVNEWNNFTCEKKANFKSPEKKGKPIEMEAFNCICACLDRIDELVAHCNTLELKSLFGLYDIFNYGQTLIDCISMISKIFRMKRRMIYRALTKRGMMEVVMMRSISNIFVRYVLYIRLKQANIKYIREMSQSGVPIYQVMAQ